MQTGANLSGQGAGKDMHLNLPAGVESGAGKSCGGDAAAGKGVRKREMGEAGSTTREGCVRSARLFGT